MFTRSDFWIGLAIGAVAGVFGYRFMQEREQQMMALQQGQPGGQVPLEELERQKEELEDLIAAQKAPAHSGGCLLYSGTYPALQPLAAGMRAVGPGDGGAAFCPAGDKERPCQRGYRLYSHRIRSGGAVP